MVVQSCAHEQVKKFGKNATGKQRIRCKCCGKTWLEDAPQPLGDMRIRMKDAATALSMILEGMSLRAVSRITGLHLDTLGDLILTVGENCGALLDSIRGVEAQNVEADEIWGFVGMKEKVRIARNRLHDMGDTWCWIAVESSTKMILAHQVGERDADTCYTFLHKLRERTTGRFQLSSDGLGAYKNTVPYVLGSRVDFAILQKNYASSQTETRYSPAKIISIEKQHRWGAPDMEKVCTSHVERVNLTLRMSLRRYTRLTNGHSKSLKHHEAMLNIFFAFYNFARVNTGLEGKQTPAMASGLTDKVWSLKELLEKAAEAEFTAQGISSN